MTVDDGNSKIKRTEGFHKTTSIFLIRKWALVFMSDFTARFEIR